MDKNRCPGFKAGAFSAAIKKKGRNDIGLIFSEAPASVAGVFTQNRIKAAPVLLDIDRSRSGHCRAIIANSGNANCCTGPQGMRDAEEMTARTAEALGIAAEEVLVASTGVIGTPLPMERIRSAIPDLVKALHEDGFADLAQAILTTDTVPKLVSAQGIIDGEEFTVLGCAKGSGMIAPNMATMLCFLVTDVKVSPQMLNQILREGVEKSLNRITIDGDTSTNDTTLIMANGTSDVAIDTPESQTVFQGVLDSVLNRLARELVQDGEGVTKLVEIIVQGALSDEDALKVADTVAGSSLVKTAFFGEDANWGRIFMALGRAGAPINPDTIDLFFDDIMMVQDSSACGPEAEAQVDAVLKKPAFSVRIDLKMGTGQASKLTCDLSVNYVKINADYRT